MTFYAQLDRGDTAIDVIASCEIDRDASGNIEVTLESAWREGDASRTPVELTGADEELLRAIAAERAKLRVDRDSWKQQAADWREDVGKAETALKTYLEGQPTPAERQDAQSIAETICRDHGWSSSYALEIQYKIALYVRSAIQRAEKAEAELAVAKCELRHQSEAVIKDLLTRNGGLVKERDEWRKVAEGLAGRIVKPDYYDHIALDAFDKLKDPSSTQQR
jgi:hypothetical protein